MGKHEPRCIGCGCWRSSDDTGYCIHDCEVCRDLSTDNPNNFQKVLTKQ